MDSRHGAAPCWTHLRADLHQREAPGLNGAERWSPGVGFVRANRTIIGAYAARAATLRTPDPTPQRPRRLPKQVRYHCATPRPVSCSGNACASRATPRRLAYSARTAECSRARQTPGLRRLTKLECAPRVRVGPPRLGAGAIRRSGPWIAGPPMHRPGRGASDLVRPSAGARPRRRTGGPTRP